MCDTTFPLPPDTTPEDIMSCLGQSWNVGKLWSEYVCLTGGPGNNTVPCTERGDAGQCAYPAAVLGPDGFSLTQFAGLAYYTLLAGGVIAAPIALLANAGKVGCPPKMTGPGLLKWCREFPMKKTLKNIASGELYALAAVFVIVCLASATPDSTGQDLIDMLTEVAPQSLIDMPVSWGAVGAIVGTCLSFTSSETHALGAALQSIFTPG